MINIPEITYNNQTIPEGRYTYINMLQLVDAYQKEENGYKYIVLPAPLQEGETLSTCYYFHNLEVGQSSCLDAMYEVCNDTKIDLVNLTGTYDLTTIQPFQVPYYLASVNGVGSIQQLTPTLSNTAATMVDYYNLFNLGGTVAVNINNTYCISVPNSICAFVDDPNNEWNPASIFISNNIANDNPSVTNIPSFFYAGQPLKPLTQFSNVTQINIPNGIYTFSQFKELLPTILPEGYSFANDIISASIPENIFNIVTPLFNINETGFTMSYKLHDPMETYRGVSYLSSNKHLAVFPESSNPSFLLNFTNGPRFVECPITNFPVYFNINTSNFHEVMDTKLYNVYNDVTLDQLAIPTDPVYTKVKLSGYFSNPDITIPKEVTINGAIYTCNSTLDIQSDFTLPLTCSGNVTFTGRAYLKGDF